MGWNDRLPDDPYTPPAEYYRDRDEYEAWLEYIDMQLAETEKAGLTSQNLDPANLQNTPVTRAPTRDNVLSRLWSAIFGPETPKSEKQDNNHTQNEEVPF